MNKVFIQTNNKQLFGAILAKFAIEKNLKDKDSVSVEFINVDTIPVFKDFAYKKYLFAGQIRKYEPSDLQSFTISRFMAPELANYQGHVVVMDPDIFALTDINELFALDTEGKAITCCEKKSAWDTSVMLLDTPKLKHWKIEDILNTLSEKKIDYTDLMTLKKEVSIQELPRIWNNLDELTPATKLIHMTNRLTQPWKTGLPIDFTRNKMPKLFGFIPREPIYKLLGKIETRYQKHPNLEVEKLFFSIAKEALECDVITKQDIEKEIEMGYIRRDFLERMRKLLP